MYSVCGTRKQNLAYLTRGGECNQIINVPVGVEIVHHAPVEPDDLISGLRL